MRYMTICAPPVDRMYRAERESGTFAVLVIKVISSREHTFESRDCTRHPFVVTCRFMLHLHGEFSDPMFFFFDLVYPVMIHFTPYFTTCRITVWSTFLISALSEASLFWPLCHVRVFDQMKKKLTNVQSPLPPDPKKKRVLGAVDPILA